MIQLPHKRLFWRRFISGLTLCLFFLNIFIEDALALAPAPGTTVPAVRSDARILYLVATGKLKFAENAEDQNFLALNHAEMLLLSHGKMLASKELKKDSLRLNRKIDHEEIEAIMQIMAKKDRSRYSDIINMILFQKGIFRSYFAIKGNSRLELSDELLANDIIATAFEIYLAKLAGLISDDGQLTAAEREFFKTIKPIIDAHKHDYFTGMFWDASTREQRIRIAMANGMRFYQVAAAAPKADSSAEKIKANALLANRLETDGLNILLEGFIDKYVKTGLGVSEDVPINEVWQIRSVSLTNLAISIIRREGQNYLMQTKLDVERMKAEIRQKNGLPMLPIVAIKFKGEDGIWALDGHHRIVIAKDMGATSIPAHLILLENPRNFPDDVKLRKLHDIYTDPALSDSDFVQRVNKPACERSSYERILSNCTYAGYLANNLVWKDERIVRRLLIDIPKLSQEEAIKFLRLAISFLESGKSRPVYFDESNKLNMIQGLAQLPPLKPDVIKTSSIPHDEECRIIISLKLFKKLEKISPAGKAGYIKLGAGLVFKMRGRTECGGMARAANIAAIANSGDIARAVEILIWNLKSTTKDEIRKAQIEGVLAALDENIIEQFKEALLAAMPEAKELLLKAIPQAAASEAKALPSFTEETLTALELSGGNQSKAARILDISQQAASQRIQAIREATTERSDTATLERLNKITGVLTKSVSDVFSPTSTAANPVPGAVISAAEAAAPVADTLTETSPTATAQRIEITVPSEGLPEEATFTTSLKGLEETSWQEFGSRAAELSGKTTSYDKSGQSLILYADDILENAVVVDLENTVKNVLKEHSIFSGGKIILVARNEANAVLLERMIKRANPALQTAIIKQTEIQAKDAVSEIEEIMGHARAKDAKDILAIIRGPMEIKESEKLAEFLRETNAEKVRLPPVIIVGTENRSKDQKQEKAIYSLAQAIAAAIDINMSNGANGWVRMLPPIKSITIDIYNDYQRHLQALIAA